MIAIAARLEVNQSADSDQHAAGVLSSCALATPLIDRFVTVKGGLRPTRVSVGGEDQRPGSEIRATKGTETPGSEIRATKGTETPGSEIRATKSTEDEAQSKDPSPPSEALGTSPRQHKVGRGEGGNSPTHPLTHSPTHAEGELRHFDSASKFVPSKGGDGGTPPLHLWLRREMNAKALANLGRAIKRVNDDGQREHEHGAALRTVSEAAGVRVNLKRVLVCVDEHDQAVVDTLKPTRDLYDRAHATTTIMEDRAVGVAPAARKGTRGCTVSNVQGAQPRLYPPSAMTSQGVAHDSAMDDTYERQQWLRANGMGETEARHDAVEQRMDALRVLGPEAFRAMVRGKTR